MHVIYIPNEESTPGFWCHRHKIKLQAAYYFKAFMLDEWEVCDNWTLSPHFLFSQ